MPAMLAWGSATPDNSEAIRHLSYAWSAEDRRFELRLRRTREPVWQRVSRWGASARPRGFSAAERRSAVNAVVDLVRRTGAAPGVREARLSALQCGFQVRIGGRRRALSALAIELESAAPADSPELAAALRASVLVATSVESWRR